MVDTISSLGLDRHAAIDEWGVDVAVAGSQKGLMLPPGLSFNAASSDKAIAAHESAQLPRSYWDWDEMIGPNDKGVLPLHARDQPALRSRRGDRHAGGGGARGNVFARHERHAEATRAAVRAWGGLEVLCEEPRHHSGSLTAVCHARGPQRRRTTRQVMLEHFDMSLGNGLSKVADRVFRIGHLGDFNDLMLMGTLSGVEMGLELAGVPHRKAGARAGGDGPLDRDALRRRGADATA